MTSGVTWGADIVGTWRNIDDKTGTSKGIIQITKEANGTYTGKIVRVTPRPGYTPKESCVNCPGDFKDKPMLGLNVLNGLKKESETEYGGGKILDPLSGKLYSVKAKLSANGKNLKLRGFVGVSALGRSQTWYREE
ncbi:DUF2147 domain-containing protein [Acinetobacter shaoyimingii]|nr:DUF2147 domain-containing protein [Acinetobacter shaoyimingii]